MSRTDAQVTRSGSAPSGGERERASEWPECLGKSLACVDVVPAAGRRVALLMEDFSSFTHSGMFHVYVFRSMLCL